MLFEIQELEAHPIDFEEKFVPGTIEFGPDLQQESDLRTSGRTQLVEEHHGKHKLIQDIRVNGKLSGTFQVACARCLDLISEKVESSFDLLYRPLGADAGQEEMSVTATEAEISYYEGDSLLLEDILREQVLLAIPLKAICREDCKGLCPHCGKNLNNEKCTCAEPVEDPRWSALREIRSKMH